MYIGTTMDFFQGQSSYEDSRNYYHPELKSLSFLMAGIQLGQRAASAYEDTQQWNWTFQQAKESVRITKSVFLFRKIPNAIVDGIEEIKETAHLIQSLEDQSKHSEVLKKILLIFFQCIALLKTLFFLVSDALIKPLLESKEMEANPHYDNFLQASRFLSFFKHCTKVIHFSGELFTGTKKPIQKSIRVIVELSEVTLGALKIAGKIHPIATLIHSIGKCIFKGYEIWLETA